MFVPPEVLFPFPERIVGRISGEISTPSIVAVTVANQGRDIRDLEPGIFEKLLCFFHAVFRQVLVQSLTSFTLKKGTHIRSRQEDVFADIFDGKRLMHIILTDIILDQKDGWIFLRGRFCLAEKLRSLVHECLMQLREGETVVNCFGNAFHITGTCNFLLMTCIFQTEKKFVIQVFDRILQKTVILKKVLMQHIQKLFGTISILT